jgi:hypothetical protein
MTDMHREADLIIRLRRLINQWRMPTRATRESDNCASGLEEAIEDYDTAMRYRGEQEKGE